MSRVEVPKKDAQFANWAKRFAENAAVYAAELNLTPEQVEALTESVEQFWEAYTESQAAKAMAAGKVNTKDSLRRVCEDLIRPTARVINANPSIGSGLKANLGINVTTRSVGSVLPPTDLASQGFANGVNKLSWDRNENARNTTFLIEAAYDNSGVWTFVGVTNKTKFVHSGQIPGRQVIYRAFAARDDVRSSASNETIIYPLIQMEKSIERLAA